MIKGLAVFSNVSSDQFGEIASAGLEKTQVEWLCAKASSSYEKWGRPNASVEAMRQFSSDVIIFSHKSARKELGGKRHIGLESVVINADSRGFKNAPLLLAALLQNTSQVLFRADIITAFADDLAKMQGVRSGDDRENLRTSVFIPKLNMLAEAFRTLYGTWPINELLRRPLKRTKHRSEINIAEQNDALVETTWGLINKMIQTSKPSTKLIALYAKDGGNNPSVFSSVVIEGAGAVYQAQRSRKNIYLSPWSKPV